MSIYSFFSCLNEVVIIVINIHIYFLGLHQTFNGFYWAVTWFIHGDFTLRVLVDTKRNCVSIKIINWVEMLQEGISDQEQVLVLSWKSAFVNNKVAFIMVRFVKVLLWINFEHIVTHLETNWLNLWGNVLAGILNVAKSLVWSAVKIW